MKTSLHKSLSIYLLFLNALLTSFTSLAGNTDLISLTGEGYYNLSSSIQYYEDKDDSVQHWELWEAEIRNEIPWQHDDSDQINFGLTTSPYWFKVRLVNENFSNEEWILELASPLMDNVDIYLFNSDGRVTQYYYSGDQISANQKTVPHPNFIFPLDLPSLEERILYVHIKSKGAIQIPFNLWTWEEFNKRTINYFILQGIFIGFVTIMLLFNIAMFVAKKEVIYMFYSGYILFITLFNLGRLGISYQFLWPFSPGVNDLINIVSPFIAIGCLCYFISSFFDLKKNDQTLNRVTLAVGKTYFALGFFSIFIPYNLSVLLLAILATSVSLFLVIVSTRMLQKRHPYANYFATAWYSFLIGALVLALNKLGIIERSVLTEYGVQIGVSIEILCFSLALGDRMVAIKEKMITAKNQSMAMAIQISKEKEKSFELQKQFLQQSIEQNHNLERKVQQRTLELNNALEELSEANSRLKQASITDGLTGLHNRYYFDEKWQTEYKRAHRDQSCLSLVMLDIDHFKSINDQYGHPAGDKCIKEVTRVLVNNASREVDVVARYGGEEFAIILPNTQELGAEKVGEIVRKEVEDLKVTWEDKVIHMTISIGISSQTPKDADYLSREAMLKRADQALYEAKRGGRNRTVIYTPA